MDFAISFISGMLIAILSSVPVGPLGFAIVHAVIANGRMTGLRLGLGGLIVDCAFALLAFRLTGIFSPEDNPELFSWIMLVSIPVLVILGLNMIRNRHQEPATEPKSRFGGGWLTGFTIGITNPVLFGYWVWVASYTTGAGWVADSLDAQLVFLGGVVTGMLMFLLAWTKLLSMATVKASRRFRAFFSLSVGIGFMVFSGFLLVRYLVENFG
jgi:threonine/homoserine/homoserine lactone efflux protein